ncbi:FAD dependent oxidoreductase-domain-containing protein [Corynascus novoguineensis]|uniref:Amine oxidase n=1 Tax=Corynascus novoguineensis TaxID=1126955 RepID=A0AAN7CR65_9PEZI|nr:FAD dependent oxidoreductase-domain-containing protein [Corynascus novoguineensis]
MTIRKISPAEVASETGTLTLPPAGLPSRNPTRSYWLREPSAALLGHRSTPELPETADVVVVGSGITGAFAARFLKDGLALDGRGRGGDQRVLMLEAREACSGATGRNGGHCQPLVYGSVPAVAAFELEVFKFLERLVTEEGVECDWVSLTGVHAFLSENMFELAVAEAEQLNQSHPELAAQLEIVRASEGGGAQTLASLRVPSAQGAIIQQKAASLWPYKLVATILERLIAKYPHPSFNLQTNTPVTSLARAESGSGWIVTTPRGSITANQVLLATNGYTSHLLPAFSDLIVPVRGQIGALLPPRPNSSDEGDNDKLPARLTHSYVFAADPEPGRSSSSASSTAAPRDDYLVQRPLGAGGELIYGGGRRLARGLGVGEWRDDEVEPEVARYLRRELCPPLDLSTSTTTTSSSSSAAAAASPGPFSSPLSSQERGQVSHSGQEDGQQQEFEASFEWTGVIGYSRDHHAWVGPVPESLGGGGPAGGLWICAGYTGHGMPAAALSAREVVRQMVGAGEAKKAEHEGQGHDEEKGRVEVKFPSEFALDEERVARARALPQLTLGWEATNFSNLVGGGSSASASGNGK